ncbi:hypothetical protein ACHQM5_016445 [Ranunculus cassubicifolius]
MAAKANQSELDYEFLPFLRAYKNGRIERLFGTEFLPPSVDSQIPVSSKDVTINTETSLSARLYLPKTASTDKKLPLLIYIHGGGFVIESAFSPFYHNYLNSLVEMANVVAVSVEYRLAPEHYVPAAYSDTWEAMQWIAQGNDAWLRDFADFDKVFVAGDSAGANIVHHMTMRAKEEALPNGVKFRGIVLVMPYFWGEEKIGKEGDHPHRDMLDKLWIFGCPTTKNGNDDPWINPMANGALSFSNLACERVLIFVAESDILRDRGWMYYETLKKSGWGGEVEFVETEGEVHVFHLFNPTCDNAVIKMKRLASFLNQ